MKKFVAPELKLFTIDSADIIATSLGIHGGTVFDYQSRRGNNDPDDWEDDFFEE